MGRLKKSLRYKSQALVVGLLVLIAVILVNVLARGLSLRLDLTEDREYTLSPATRKILAGLDDQVTLKLFFSENAPSRIEPILDQVRDLVEEFRVHAKGKLSVQIIDPDDSPEREQEVQMLGIPPLQLNVVERDKAEVRKIYLGVALFYADKKEILPVVSEPTHLEYDLTLSLLKLTSDQMPKIGLLNVSSTPDDFSLFENVLSRQLEIVRLTVQDKDWKDKGLDAVILLDATRLAPETVKQVDFAFEAGLPVIALASGVNVSSSLIALPQSTGLEEWLKEKGLEFVQPLVIDPKFVGRAAFSSGVVQYQLPYPFFVNVPHEGLNPDHAVTNKLENIVFPWTSSFRLDPAAHPDWIYDILASSSEAAFLQDGEPNVTPQALEELTEIPPGEKRPLAVLVQSKTGNKKLLAVATASLLKNAFLNDFEGNLIFVQNIIDWATTGEDLIGIRSRGKTLRPIPALDSQSMQLIRWAHLILTPALFLAFGYFIRRHHLKKLNQLAARLQ